MKPWIDQPFWKACWLAAWVPIIYVLIELAKRDEWSLVNGALLVSSAMAMALLARTAAYHLDR